MDNNKSPEEIKAFEMLSSIKPEYISKYLLYNREEVLYKHKSSFSDEPELKNWFNNQFSRWFVIHKNIKGKGYVNKKEFQIFADFILEPKEELKSKGITSYFGVEVKFINAHKGFFTQLNELSFQALSYSYSNSEWLVNDKYIKTEAFLIFTNLSFATEKSIFETIDKMHNCWWNSKLSLINHANVGEIKINTYKNTLNSWYLHFSGSNYCKWYKDSGITLQNKNVIGKYRIGNIKKS